MISFGTLGEHTNPFAKQDAEGAKDTSDLVLQVAAGSHELAASGKERPSFVACRRFYMDTLAPARTNDLRQADGVVAVRLGRHHLQGRIGVPSIHADDGNATFLQSIP